jgi:hypothetical protein
VNVNEDELAASTDEDDFVQVAFHLMRELTSYVCVTACLMGTFPTWNRDQAVIGGNLVRLFKLFSALLDQTAQNRREITDILARLCFETAVNIRYFLKDPCRQRFDSYMRHSLRHERKLSDRIHKNMKDRGGQTRAIEERMLRSLAKAEEDSGILLSDVDLRDKGPWGGKHLHQKATDVGWAEPYEAMFGGLSHFVHGSWQDLLSHQLSTVGEGRFEPALDWSMPRPQALLALSRLTISAVVEAIAYLGGEEASDQLDPKLEDLFARLRLVDQLHEAFLSR